MSSADFRSVGVNVKVNIPSTEQWRIIRDLRAEVGDTEADSICDDAWERWTGEFWVKANEVAHEIGYSGVLQEGRSGGWCVPYYGDHRLPDIEDPTEECTYCWGSGDDRTGSGACRPCQGEGRVTMLETEEQRRHGFFSSRIRALLDYYYRMYMQDLTTVVRIRAKS
jgi:hypothetical protein